MIFIYSNLNLLSALLPLALHYMYLVQMYRWLCHLYRKKEIIKYKEWENKVIRRYTRGAHTLSASGLLIKCLGKNDLQYLLLKMPSAARAREEEDSGWWCNSWEPSSAARAREEEAGGGGTMPEGPPSLPGRGRSWLWSAHTIRPYYFTIYW